ncbi:MAG TPA: helix-turn-helix domain-containing protein [Candidatus Paceibacterota bacterium]|nr:helix-turn-helix domain-containing protein [Candidatus Paceibacterota bacterium]
MYYTLRLPHKTAHDPFLSTDEKLILSYIQSFERQGKTCFTKNDSINECLGIPIVSIERALQNLTEKKYIDIRQAGGQRAIFTVGLQQTNNNYEHQEQSKRDIFDF